ncbi:MAG: XDD4 family exosortase-dependent surface protein [Verrucomicrobiia bacterium]|jgi:hypothetical protein
MRIVAGVVAAFAIVTLGATARGQTVTASGPGTEPGETLGASATFAVSNLELIVTLSNTGTFDPVNANDVLTAVFFKVNGDLKLTPQSADVAPGSSVIDHPHPLPLGFSGDVGSQWAYRNDLIRAPNGTDEGISSTSLKWFGTKNLFSSEKIKGFGSIGGISFGITTFDDLGGHKRGNLKNQALAQNSVVFTFSGLPDDFSLSDISDVTFQYGTSVKAPDLIGGAIANVPEPPTIALVVAGMIGALGAMRCGVVRKPTVVY